MRQLSNQDYLSIIKFLSFGADFVYKSNKTLKEENLARRMRMMSKKMERKKQ